MGVMGGELGSLQQCWGKAVPKSWELQPAPRVLVATDRTLLAKTQLNLGEQEAEYPCCASGRLVLKQEML